MKRLLAMLLALSMVVSLLPATVLAEGTGEEETFRTEQAVDPVMDPEEDFAEPSEEETTAPTEETTEPTEETTEPTEETTEPTEETTEPAGETTAPTEEPTDPAGETTAPTEETTEPTEEMTEPTPVSEEAAMEAVEAAGQCGEKLTWRFDPETGILTVEGQGPMYDYAYDQETKEGTAPWFGLDVQALVIENGVTYIGSSAFAGMTCLAGELVLPESMKTVGQTAFYETALTAVTLNEGLEKLDFGAFAGCQSLTLTTGFPDSLQEIGLDAFLNCKALGGELSFGSKLAKLAHVAFYGTGITKVTLPDQLTAEGYHSDAFMCCESLTEILVSAENKNFRSVDGVLYSADGKTLLSGPAGKTGVLTVPEGVETIEENAFWGGHITTVSLPKSLLTVGEGAFQASGVHQVQYAGSWADKADIALNGNLEDAQWHYAPEGTCGDHLTWSYDEAAKTLTVSGDGAIPANEDGGQKLPWQGADIGKLVVEEGVTAIGSGAFGGLPLTQVRLPASLAECNFQEAFAGCTGLTIVEIAPENETFASVDGVAYSYGETTLLFCPAGRTKTLTISDKTQTIASKAFASSGVRGLFLPASLQTVEENAFLDAKLSWVSYLGTPEQKETLWEAIADGNAPLKDAEWKTAESKIGEGLEWSYDAKNKVLTITGAGEMDDYSPSFPAPWQGKTVNNLVVEAGITYLGSYGFANLALKTMTLPESLVSVGENAFAGAPKAIQVTYGGSNERWTYGGLAESCGLNSPKMTCKGKNVSGGQTWSYNAKTKTLSFTGSGWMDDYSREELPDWLTWGIPAEKLVFSDGETGIGDYAFYGMTGLKQVSLSKKLVSIGDWAFADSGLTGKLTIPDSWIAIGTYAFRGTQITSLTLPENVWIQGGNAFDECAQLTDIYYGGYENVLRKMLGDAISPEVQIHGRKQNGGTVGLNACWSLDKQGTLTLWGTDGQYGVITDFNSYADTPWADLTVKKLVVRNIIFIGANAFNGCAGLTGDLTLENLCSMGENAFAGTGLKTLRISGSWYGEWVETLLERINARYGTELQWGIAENAFAGSKLTDIYYSGAESYLRELLGEGHPLLGKKLHCAYPYGGWDNRLEQGIVIQWAIDSKGVLSFPAGNAIPDYGVLEAPWCRYKVTALKLDGIISIGSYAFYGLNNLTKLSIPGTVKTIGTGAFFGCAGIGGTLTIPEGVEEIGWGAFGILSKVTALKLPVSLKKLASYAFYECTGLKTITYAGSLGQVLELDDWLWHYDAKIICQSGAEGTLECGAEWALDTNGTLTVRGEGPLNLTVADQRKVRSFEFQKLVIQGHVTEIGDSAFANMGMAEVILPEGLTKLGEEAFYMCMQLTGITLPATLRELGRYSLDNYCLQSVSVAKGSEFLTVKDGALYTKDMTRLLLVPAGVRELTVPDSVTSVAQTALENGNLTALTLGAGITRDSVEGQYDGLLELEYRNSLVRLSVSEKNPRLRAVDNVLFEGNTLLFYPSNLPAAEYRVPDGTEEIAWAAFFFEKNLRRLILPTSVKKLERGCIGYPVELMDLGMETEIAPYEGFRKILCRPGSQAEAYAKQYNIEYSFLTDQAVLTFAAEAGVTGVPEEVTVPTGTPVTIPKKAPGLKGYTFRGWQEETTKVIYQPGDTLPLSEDTTLTALFRKNSIVQSGTCGADTRWTLEKNGTLTISGTGEASQLSPEKGDTFTAKRLVIEEGVTHLGANFFGQVTLKGQVTIPASMEYIGGYAFAYQKGITKLTFAENPNGRLMIGFMAFTNCPGLKGAVTLPAQLAYIASSAFAECTGITALNTTLTHTIGGYTGIDGVLYEDNDEGKRLWLCPEGKTGAITVPKDTTAIEGFISPINVKTVYYQGTEEGWRSIRNWDALPVYPSFAYDIRYTSNVDSPSGAHKTFTHRNPPSILATQTVTLKNAAMNGYIFRGWYNEAGQKVTKIAKGTQDTVVLTARFDPITYTVAYNANGGKGSMAKVTVTYDQEQTVAGSDFTRNGYFFEGWNTAKNGKGTWYHPEDLCSSLTAKNKGTVTLYAQWVPIGYELKYDPNGGEGSMEGDMLFYDVAKTLEPNSFTRTGYTFTGWKDGNGKTYKNKASVKNLTNVNGAAVTLYAQWAAKKITVVFHSNYPNGAKEKTTRQTVTCGKETTLAKNAFAVKGYTFAGWSETKDGEVKYTNTQSDTFYSDNTIDLYAVWTPIILQ